MDKINTSINNNQKIKFTLIDIFPSIEELEKAKKDLVIIFQGINNFYNLKELLTKKTEIILETDLPSIILSLIELDNLLATSVFTIKPGEHWVTFSYENQKKTNNLAIILINCIKIKLSCDIIVPQNLLNSSISKKDLKKIKNRRNTNNKKFQKNMSKTNFIKSDTSLKIDSHRSLLNENSLFLIDTKKIKKNSYKEFSVKRRSPIERIHSITDSALNTLRPVNRKINTDYNTINNNSSKKHLRAFSGHKKSEIFENSGMKRFNTNQHFYTIKSKGKNNDYNDKDTLLRIIKSHKIIIEQYDLNKKMKKLNNEQSEKNKNNINKADDNPSKDEMNKCNSNLVFGLKNKYKNKNIKGDLKKSVTKTVNYFYSTANFKGNKNNTSLNNSNSRPSDIKSIAIKMGKESPRNNFNKKNNLATTSGRNYISKKNPYFHKQNLFTNSIENYYNFRDSKKFIEDHNSISTDNDNSDDYENEISNEDIGKDFLKLKDDFFSVYNEKYLKNIKNDLLKLEIELLVEKMNVLIYEYHSQMYNFTIENKLLLYYLKQNSENYLIIKKLFNKLYFIQKESKTRKRKIKKYEDNIDKYINKNINIYKNEFGLFELLFEKKKTKKNLNEKDKEILKNIISILIDKNNNIDLIINENKQYRNWIEFNFKTNGKKFGRWSLKDRSKIALQTSNALKMYNKSNLNEDDIEGKNPKYINTHTDDTKRDKDGAYIKKTPITPIYSRKYQGRKKLKQ